MGNHGELSKGDLSHAMKIHCFAKHYIMLREDTALSYRGRHKLTFKKANVLK